VARAPRPRAELFGIIGKWRIVILEISTAESLPNTSRRIRRIARIARPDCELANARIAQQTQCARRQNFRTALRVCNDSSIAV